jgi:hypothetical protein
MRRYRSFRPPQVNRAIANGSNRVARRYQHSTGRSGRVMADSAAGFGLSSEVGRVSAPPPTAPLTTSSDRSARHGLQRHTRTQRHHEHALLRPRSRERPCWPSASAQSGLSAGSAERRARVALLASTSSVGLAAVRLRLASGSLDHPAVQDGRNRRLTPIPLTKLPATRLTESTGSGAGATAS